MKGNLLESDFKVVTKQPKYSKEQKIVQKALSKINYFIYSQYIKKDDLSDLYYACGLLESLLFKDDVESQCEPSSVK